MDVREVFGRMHEVRAAIAGVHKARTRIFEYGPIFREDINAAYEDIAWVEQLEQRMAGIEALPPRERLALRREAVEALPRLYETIGRLTVRRWRMDADWATFPDDVKNIVWAAPGAGTRIIQSGFEPSDGELWEGAMRDISSPSFRRRCFV